MRTQVVSARVVGVLATCAFATVDGQTPPMPPDPVGQWDFPDPAATFADGTFYAFGGSMAMQSTNLTSTSSALPTFNRTPVGLHGGHTSIERQVGPGRVLYPVLPVSPPYRAAVGSSFIRFRMPTARATRAAASAAQPART
eukprot:gene10711-9397_t